jgi:SNF2 family DNA or RNA helicase
VEFFVKPWAHQAEAITRAEALDEFALFFDVGTGKTCTAINILRHKFNLERRILRTLVLGPPIILKNWKDEFAMHSKLKPDQVIVLHGSATNRMKLLKRYGYDSNGNRTGRIFVTNYESLGMEELFEAIKAWHPEFLIADESHKLKDLKALRTKRACQLAIEEFDKKTKALIRPAPKYKLALTGSPILNSPMDIFSQYLFLDGGKTFGRNFFVFRSTYFYDKNAGMPKHRYFPDWQPIPAMMEVMNEKIFAKAAKAKKADCLDLPPFIKKKLYVQLTPKQRKMYEELKAEFVTWMEREGKDPSPIVAQLAITKALRLMQLTTGFVKTESGEEIQFAENPRLDALEELLKEKTPEHKVIIWAVWRENYVQLRGLCEKLKLSYVEVTGDIPAQKRFEFVEKFNTDPDCRVFISHPGAGGIGINLVSKCDVPSDIAVNYSRNFSLEHSIQAEARNYRGGAEKFESVVNYDFLAENSIDEVIDNCLSEKIKISERVLREISSKI